MKCRFWGTKHYNHRFIVLSPILYVFLNQFQVKWSPRDNYSHGGLCTIIRFNVHQLVKCKLFIFVVDKIIFFSDCGIFHRQTRHHVPFGNPVARLDFATLIGISGKVFTSRFIKKKTCFKYLHRRVVLGFSIGFYLV